MRQMIPVVISGFALSYLLLGQAPPPPPPPPSPASTSAAQPMPTSPTGAERPKFVASDIHAAAKGYPNSQTPLVHDGRYELKNLTMLDMIRIAYGFDADKILAGPSWLEMDRYDITAKLPGESSPNDQKLMLQTLLEDRFKLVVRKETKPIPGYALTASKKTALKAAAGTETSGCTPQSSSGPAEGGSGTLMAMVNGSVVRLAMGPDAKITYNCRNVTMEQFVQGMRAMLGSGIGTSPLVEDTGLNGAWNFDVSYSLGISLLNGGSGRSDHISLAEALDKQAGLKLDARQIPTPVLTVESVNRTPTPNAPDLAQTMPPMRPATEFDVASVKPSDSSTPSFGFQIQPGGRVTTRGLPMSELLYYCFNDWNSPLHPQINGIPKWADSARYDIVAKTPPDTAPLDARHMGPALIALLKDRFKLAYHVEQQPGPAFSLRAVKPKMQAADPANRAGCKNSTAPTGSPGGPRLMTCKNMTMAQFADYLSYNGNGINGPVSDDTALDGAWDFVLNFNNAGLMAALGASGAQPGDGQSAAEPTAGYTMLEAMEKQLGLKLESVKRPQPVYVIDHLEEKPTEDQ